MMRKIFNSEKSKDIIQIEHYKKSHNAIFQICKFDLVSENIKLLGEVLEYIKMNDIKWVILDLSTKFAIPENTVWFKNKKTGLIHCHIEDFEKFYLKNMMNFIKPSNLFLDSDIQEESEWTIVMDKKKERKIKINKISREIKTTIQGMIGDWNNL